VVKLTGVLALVAFLQLLVYAYQAKKTKETVESAGEQAEAMERHIGESARSATAMESVAKSLQTTAEVSSESIKALSKQMRAYLFVNIGTAVFQDRAVGLKFEGKPLLINTGHTPARKIRFNAKAAILASPLPGDYVLAMPGDDALGSPTTNLGAGQNAIMNAVIDDFVDDAEVEDIKLSRGKALYVWGLVKYEDVFGEDQTVHFCQSMIWIGDKVMGYFTPGRNDST
jgi:hypothetical protein